MTTYCSIPCTLRRPDGVCTAAGADQCPITDPSTPPHERPAGKQLEDFPTAAPGRTILRGQVSIGILTLVYASSCPISHHPPEGDDPYCIDSNEDGRCEHFLDLNTLDGDVVIRCSHPSAVSDMEDVP